MKIMISGSMKFANEMLAVKKQLEKLGHTVFVPPDTDFHISNPDLVDDLDTNLNWAQEQDVMRRGFDLIAESDAILVLNHERNGIQGYMGISTLMESALAYYLRKKIFILHDVPSQNKHRWAHEVALMNPIFIQGDLGKII